MANKHPNDIIIRRARRSDRDSILAFTKDTFHWGDYLEYVWDEWQRSRKGRLLIASVGGKPVGNIHVAFMGKRDAWFEGMRVHPEYRKQGIARRLDARALEVAREAGCSIVRLETATDNLQAQASLARFGYRRVLRLREWVASASEGEIVHSRPAQIGDLALVSSIWEHSWIRIATRSLSPVGNPWHWAGYEKARLRESIERGYVWVAPRKGMPRGFAELSREKDATEVMLVVGRKRETAGLLFDFRVLAGQRGQPKCFLVLPDANRTKGWARACGYEAEQEGMFVYERPL